MSLKLLVFLTACLVAVTAQELCDKKGNGHFTGILPGSDGHHLILKGQNYWKLTGNFSNGFNLADGFPKKIASHWPGIPKNVEIERAFFNSKFGVTYFVQGGKIWAYKGTELKAGFPKADTVEAFEDPDEEEDLVVKRFTKLVVDTKSHAFCFFAPDPTHFYTFKGSKYSKYNTSNAQLVKGYPKDVVPFWFSCPTRSSNKG